MEQIEQAPVTVANADRLETARIGYQAAINLWTFQSNLNWSRFGAMLTANAIIAAAIGFLPSFPQKPGLLGRVLPLSLPLAGLVLCGLWWVLMDRGEGYRRHWNRKAREIEEAHLHDIITTVSSADLDSPNCEIVFPGLGKLIGQEGPIKGAIGLFVLLYVVLIVSGLF